MMQDYVTAKRRAHYDQQVGLNHLAKKRTIYRGLLKMIIEARSFLPRLHMVLSPTQNIQPDIRGDVPNIITNHELTPLLFSLVHSLNNAMEHTNTH